MAITNDSSLKQTPMLLNQNLINSVNVFFLKCPGSNRASGSSLLTGTKENKMTEIILPIKHKVKKELGRDYGSSPNRTEGKLLIGDDRLLEAF